MGLQEEIDKKRAEIRSDSYSMSIGEWLNLYENGEIDIHPEFQRFYRWSDFQKSRLIESILLGIPIPPIFVAQREDGVWDVVDGLQRLSTIYQFFGILKDENQKKIPPLILKATQYLPSLEGKKCLNADNPNLSLTMNQRLLIKRAKIDVSIILNESDESGKFELYQRLKTGDSSISDQEVRNRILVMINPDYYHWLKDLSNDEDFLECVALTDRAISEQYPMDLVLRFIIFRTMPEEQLKKIGDLNEFLSEQMITLVQNKKINLKEEADAFKTTFSTLRESLDSDSFHKYNPNKDRFVEGFLVSAYELLALGIGYNYKTLIKTGKIEEIVKKLWINQDFTSKSGSGIKASSRIPVTIPLGRKSFKL